MLNPDTVLKMNLKKLWKQKDLSSAGAIRLEGANV